MHALRWSQNEMKKPKITLKTSKYAFFKTFLHILVCDSEQRQFEMKMNIYHYKITKLGGCHAF